MTLKKYFWMPGLALLLAACGDDDGGEGEGEQDMGVEDDGGGKSDGDGGSVACEVTTTATCTMVDVTAEVTSDTTWENGNCYVLKDHIFVKSGATLTIEPGVLVLGDVGSSLVVTSAGSIDAGGTAECPIVLTSSQPEGSRAAGDWGGVVLLGLAPINVAGGTEVIEGFIAGPDVTYGGNDAAHDCGTLRYVRIEFAGFELTVDNELNSLGLGGCGTGTELDFVQVHSGADDGIEFFGGTANAKHLVITQPDDDGLDWDFGWVGKVQFVALQQNAIVGENGIEADNNPDDFDSTPRSGPTIYNATLIGSDAEPGMAGVTQRAAVLRRGTAGRLHNVIMAHFTDNLVDVRDAATAAQSPANLFIKNGIFSDNANVDCPVEGTDNDAGFDECATWDAEATNRVGTDPDLADALNLDAPDFRPNAGSPALTGGATPPSDGFFDTAAIYVGAFDDNVDWMAGWTAFPQD
jgi:hypothetical protein